MCKYGKNATDLLSLDIKFKGSDLLVCNTCHILTSLFLMMKSGKGNLVVKMPGESKIMEIN